jgi:hypothetical protein
MIQKLCSIICSLALINMLSGATSLASTNQQQTAQAAKVKAEIAKLGTGPQARVHVKLQDDTKLEGYIQEAGAESFVIIDRKTGAATRVAYHQVQKIGGGGGLSKGAKIAIGIPIAIGAVVLTGILLNLGRD